MTDVTAAELYETAPDNLTANQYMAWLARKMREAVETTQRLDARWNRINSEINELLDRQGVQDIVQRNKVKGESLALNDALQGGKWWREKAVYLASVLQAEVVYREHFIGGRA